MIKELEMQDFCVYFKKRCSVNIECPNPWIVSYGSYVSHVGTSKGAFVDVFFYILVFLEY